MDRNRIRVTDQRFGKVCLWLLLTLLCTRPAAALTLHYDPERPDDLRECDLHAETGDRLAARACYARLGSSSDPLIRAEASRALGQTGEANRLFREAASVSRDARTLSRWGQLYLSTWQVASAAELFREALLDEPEYVAAMNGLAQAQMSGFRGEARQLLYDSLQQEPDNLQALVLLARLELELQNLDQARSLLAAAEHQAEVQSLSPLEIHALYAAADLLNGITDSEWTDKALALNPHYGDIYSIPAHFYIITYRYREAVALYRKAVEAEPDEARGYTGLGINLFRINDNVGARYYLKRAYELDPFNTETVNTLRLLDTYDEMRNSFVTVNADRTGEILGRVHLRVDPESADILEPYALSLAEEAVRTFTERYQFRLHKPVVIEMFDDHADFGVRTLGTPGIGLLGVTFGYVTAMDSPRARSEGDFHWGTTLWHELAHVFTLEMSNHLLPRWFSEGLSVYEEWHTGPLASRELPMSVLERMAGDELLPIASLDDGFVRPTYEGQVGVSYMQAGLVCTYIAERWGHQKLVDMLNQFGKGAKTVDVLRRQLEIGADEFDKAFDAHLQARYGELLTDLDGLRLLPIQIDRLLDDQRWPEAGDLAESLIELYPAAVGPGNGYIRLARARMGRGLHDQALETLLSWHEAGGYDPDQLVALADQLEAAGRTDDVITVLESLNWVAPDRQNEHQRLGRYYLKAKRSAQALREFNALINHGQGDLGAAWFGRAQSLMLLGDDSAARRALLTSLEIAPFYRPAQRMLLEIVDGENID